MRSCCPTCSGKTINGQTWVECDPYESYPPDKPWGIRGWTFLTEGAAMKKLQQVSSRGGKGAREGDYRGWE